ncbi:fumarate reductase (CoM/CoB) subunit TfrA [Methanorbis furvi]|uniref:Succinate dehydrogenase flavoprotein subunit n=1 Tax=Methanorbis furvi TaxID=3028299 RepID=A0AAE4S976_9EURY|nr:Succinate dehydrogenase flavoprotein subunit [Methanocorpusculaceae archaeon Ag1]
MGIENRSDCHVLVIGSGGAGIRAAVDASASGDTIIVSKTITGKGGCTVMAEGGYNAVMRNADSVATHYEDTLKGGAFLNDPALVEVLARESPDRIRDLFTWGAVFDLTCDNEVAQRPFGGQRFPRTCYAGDHTGHEIVMTLLEKLRGSPVEIRDELTVIDLLKNGSEVAGAITCDREGELGIITADAVVLATGGAGQVYDTTTNSTAGTGDGYALGYRAGAELIDMEQVQFHPTGAVYPYDTRGRLITEAVRGEGGVLKNSVGERFMEKYDPARMELSTRDVVARSIATEVLEGRGTEHGGVWLDVTHLPKEQIETRLPLMLEQFLKFGTDIRTEPMEVAPTAHHFMGGLRITPDAATTLPRLFAAGEVTGGVHGGNRLGGNALADTQVFGRRAGVAAGAAEPSAKHRIDYDQIEAAEKKVAALYSGTAASADVRRTMKMLMWKNVGIYRNELDLRVAERDIAKLRATPLKINSPREIADAVITENMLLVASMIIDGALLRRESRGAHTRTDIKTPWTNENSPFGHTFFSPERSGIEILEGRV